MRGNSLYQPIDRSVECTSSAVQTLTMFRELYQGYHDEEIEKCIKGGSKFIENKQQGPIIKWLIFFLAFKSELCCLLSVLLSARALCCWRGLLCGLRMGFGRISQVWAAKVGKERSGDRRISQAWPDLTFVRGLWYKTVAGWAYKATPGRLLVHFDL